MKKFKQLLVFAVLFALLAGCQKKDSTETQSSAPAAQNTESTAPAERTVVDQLGRTVTIPAEVDNVVVLQHQTLNLLVQLNAFDSVKGVLASWERQIGPEFARLAPGIKDLPTPGDLDSVNIESLLAIKPQVVFVTNYAPKEMIDQIAAAGLPVVAISLREDLESEKDKVNPLMEDEETAYNNGLQAGIRIIGDVMGKQAEAEELIAYTFEKRKMVDERIAASVPAEKRIRTYMANPDLGTYGSGKYTGLMMNHAGAMNVAAATIVGAKQVSMEQVLEWNPEVIFVQSRYPETYKEILEDAAWKPLDAVKNGRVYLMPEYAKAWGYPMPEAIAIGELWMAKNLYPDLFSDIDMEKEADAYYQKFYRISYDGM